MIKARILSNEDKIELSITHVKHPNHVEPYLNINDIRENTFLKQCIVSSIDRQIGIIVWLSRNIKGRISFHKSNLTYDDAINKYSIGAIIKKVFAYKVNKTSKMVELSIKGNKKNTKTENIREPTKAKGNELLYKMDTIQIGDFMTVVFHKLLKNGNILVHIPSCDKKYGFINKENFVKSFKPYECIMGDKIQAWVLFKKLDKQDSKNSLITFTMNSKQVKLNKTGDAVDDNQEKFIELSRQQKDLMDEYNELMQENNDDSDSDIEDMDDIEPLNANDGLDIKQIIDKQERRVQITPMNVENNDNNDDDVKAFNDDEYNSDEDVLDDQLATLAGKIVDENKDDIKDDDIKVKKEEKLDDLQIVKQEFMESEGFVSAPKTPKEFERLLIHSPNSSKIYCEYVAFYLKKENINKARELIQRALKTISIKAEKEILNMWIAWMNVEIIYNENDDKTLIKVFKQACNSCDEKDVYYAFLDVLQQNNKYDLCFRYFESLIAKYNKNKISYIKYGDFLYNYYVNNSDKNEKYLINARNILKKGLQNIKNKQIHISLIINFAIFEYTYLNKNNINNNGKKMFEELVQNYPNKIFIWKKYAYTSYICSNDDYNKLKNSRKIFEKCIKNHSNTIKQNDMRLLFKEYLSFEQKYGFRSLDHQQNINNIKQMATNYVQNIRKQS